MGREKRGYGTGESVTSYPGVRTDERAPRSTFTGGLVGLTVAESFRDSNEGGKEILFFIDNIFRFTQAGSEVSALLGRMPSAVGYQPTLASEMGKLQERIASTKYGPSLRYRLFMYLPTT